MVKLKSSLKIRWEHQRKQTDMKLNNKYVQTYLVFQWKCLDSSFIQTFIDRKRRMKIFK